MSPRLRSTLRWGIGLLVLAALVVVFDPAAIGERLAAVDLVRALPAIVGLVAMHVLAAISWRRLAAHVGGVSLDLRTAVRLYYAAQAWGAVTPANVGADVYRVTAVDAQASRGGLARTVIAQRLASVVALVVLASVGALVVPVSTVAPLIIVPALLVGGVIGLAVMLDRGRALPGRVGRALGRRVAAPGFRSTVGTRPAAARSIVRDGLGLAVLFHALSIGLAGVLVVAVDPGAGQRLVPVLGAIAIARLSLAVPLAPNGIGLQEGALSFLFVQLGMSPEVALAAGLLNRVALIATAFLGWVAIAAGSRATARQQPAAVEIRRPPVPTRPRIRA